MKLFVWEYQEGYETYLAFAIAENSEIARTLISKRQGFTSEYLKDSPDVYDLTREAVYVASHSG